MKLEERIIKLSSIDGPSGFEENVAKYFKNEIAPYMDEVYTDVLGSVIAVRKCGKANAPKLLLDAHMDEIGFIITGIDNGFLRFSTLGGVDARMLPARDLRIMTESPIVGTVACLPVHTLSAEDMNKSVSVDELRLDIGMSDDAAQKAVPIGTPAVYNCGAEKMGKYICGKALDDRTCVAIIMDAVEKLAKKEIFCDLYIMISTQEEVGCRGAKTGVFSIAPDYCIVMDVDHGQTPDSKGKVQCKCGEGPIISIGPNMNRLFTNNIINTAKLSNIKHQISVEPSGHSGTNAAVIQVSQEGVATALISLPLKYMHTPIETISIDDAEIMSDLLVKVISSSGGIQDA